jgi:methyl coenzyme M reductase alpha subunit
MSWLGSWGQSWGPLHEVYEQKGSNGSDGALDQDQEDHLASQKAYAEKAYAKPEVIPRFEIGEIAPEVNRFETEQHQEVPPLLSNELAEIQQSVATIANEAIAKAKRQADDEEALILILSQIL